MSATAPSESHHRALRWIVVLALTISTLLFWRDQLDVFALPKLTLLLVGAVLVVAVALWRVLETGVITLPVRGAPLAVVGVIVAGAVAVIVSDSPWRSLLGQRGRGTGYLAYVAAAVLFAAVVCAFDRRTARKAVVALAVAGALCAAYAVLQGLGADPLEWNATFGPKAAFSTMGNTNFASGFLGIIAALMTAGVVFGVGRERALAAAGLVLCLGGLLAARSAQGFVAGAVGGAVVLVAWVASREPHARRRFGAALAAAAVLGAVLVVLGLGGSGPLRRLNDVGFEYRRTYWEASVEMVQDHPIAGVGFDMWAGHFRAARAAEDATIANVTDEPHSVPLALLAGGGVLLGAAYLAFVAAVLVVLVRGLLTADDPTKPLLAAVGGAWAAYQVQSLVSIDVPPFPAIHFVLAGLILVLTGRTGRSVSFDVPGARVTGRVASTRRRAGRVRIRTAGAPALVVAVLVAGLGVWQVTKPQRADIAAKDGVEAPPGGAVAGILRATELAPNEPEYWSLLGAEFLRAGRASFALEAYEKAIDHDPRAFEPTLNAARAANAADDLTATKRWYERAAELEPNAHELALERGDVLMRAFADPAGAEELARQVLEQRGDLTAAWALLAKALATQHDPGALDAARRAVAVGASPELQLDLARHFRIAEELDGAEALIEPLVDDDPRPPLLIELAKLREAQGDTAAAIDAYEILVAGWPGQYPEAEDDYRELRGA